LNFVINENNELIEIQGTGEQKTFSKEKLDEMFELASRGIKEIIEKMKKIC
jgi:ribonuclease PH